MPQALLTAAGQSSGSVGGIPSGGGWGRGIIANLSLGIKIVFQYNPQTLTDEEAVNWHLTDIQGQAGPLLTFQNSGPHTKTFEILLDAHSSPHPQGHVGEDIDNIWRLTVPHDKSGHPIIIPPAHGVSGSGTPTKSKQVVGVPPLVKIIYGGRVQKGIIRNLKVEEQLHGTTQAAKPLVLPTRARVTFDFYIVDDERMFVTYKETAPKGGSPTVSLQPAYGPFSSPSLPGLSGGGIGDITMGGWSR